MVSKLQVHGKTLNEPRYELECLDKLMHIIRWYEWKFPLELFEEHTSLAYKKHPYKVPTIGEVPEHIENARLEDVKSFFNRFYCPDNAVLSVSGNVKPEKVFELTQKWFGEIEKRKIEKINSDIFFVYYL